MQISSLGGNWVDLAIMLVLIYFLSVGWTVGFWSVLSDFFSFAASILISLRVYKFAAVFLRNNFTLSRSLSNALGFLFVAIILEGVVGYLFTRFVMKIPAKFWRKPLTKVLGLFPALAEGLIIIAFVLTLLISLPLSGKIKADISNSKLGGSILKKTAGVEAGVNDIFGGVMEDSLTYLTIQPGSRESVSIPIQTGLELKVDEQAETEMFSLVNNERRQRGIAELAWRKDVVPVARAHATDMWQRGYFGHVSPEGKDVGDRLNGEGLQYFIAGENLALAPTLITAHNGLMNSEGHRENILEPKFKRVGIGVIDNGVYGKMFVQIFTD